MNKSTEGIKNGKKVIIALLLALLSLCILFGGCDVAPDEESPPFYTVSYVAGSGGKIVGKASQTVTENEDAESVQAVPDIGYKFIGWSDKVTSETRTDANVTEDMTLTASFEKLTYTVRYDSTDGGKVVVKNGTETASADLSYSVKYGENTPTVTAEPNAGYRFVEWSDGVKDPERKGTSVKRDMTFTAKFERIIHTAYYTPTDGGGIEGTYYQRVYDGDDAATVTAVAMEGYEFIGWSDGVQSATRTDTGLTENVVVQARFSVITSDIIYLSDSGGHVEGRTRQTVLFKRDAETVRAVADEHYDFIGWSDGVKSAERTDTGVTSDISVTALFEKKTYMIKYSAWGGDGKIGDGLAMIENIQYVRYGERTEKVTAKSSSNYSHFLYWSDGLSTPSRSDIATGNISYIAYFGYTVDFVVSGNGGQIAGEAHQNVLSGQDSNYVTALANEDYVFAGWSDGETNVRRKVSNVLANTTVTAYFTRSEKTFTLDFQMENTLNASITLNRSNIENVRFIVPMREDHAFCGWYADKRYTVKVADENGVYLLGYQGLDLDTDTFYACWDWASDFTFLLNEDGKGYKVRVYDRDLTEAIIPSEYNGLPVVELDDSAFSMCRHLKKVSIPNSVTVIGNGAFISCTSLTEVNIPDSVTVIGTRAFALCTSLTEISIPDSVTVIGACAFQGCTSLTEISLSNAVSVIGDRTFLSCTSLTRIFIPDSVESIEGHAFMRCESLTEIGGMANVKKIGLRAFRDCVSLRSLTLPESLEVLGIGILLNVTRTCDVYSYLSEERLTALNVNWLSGSTAKVHYCDGIENLLTFERFSDRAGYRAIARNRQITQVDIPAYYKGLPVTEVGDNGFGKCHELTRISIPHTVTRIGSNAFVECVNLQEIEGMENVTSISNRAFAFCEKLKFITLPSSLSFIGDSIFYEIPESCTVYVYLSEGEMFELREDWNKNTDATIVYMV